MLLVNINGEKLNTKERRDKADLIETEMRMIVNHPRFDELVLKMDYHGELSHWKDATPTAILAHIKSGQEILDPTHDMEIDIFVDDYYTIKNVIGHTYPSDIFIYTNTKYFDTTSSKNSGSNFLHEWGHKMGFDHDYKKTARRPYSICYQLNDIYEQVWDELFGDPSERDKVLVCKRYLFFFQRCNWVKVKDAEPIPV